jgi:hypothetical protein
MAMILDSSGAPLTGKAREKLLKVLLKRDNATREDDK